MSEEVSFIPWKIRHALSIVHLSTLKAFRDAETEIMCSICIYRVISLLSSHKTFVNYNVDGVCFVRPNCNVMVVRQCASFCIFGNIDCHIRDFTVCSSESLIWHVISDESPIWIWWRWTYFDSITCWPFTEIFTKYEEWVWVKWYELNERMELII